MAGEDQTTASARLMVMGCLQGQCGFTTIHGAAVINQFSHVSILPSVLTFHSLGLEDAEGFQSRKQFGSYVLAGQYADVG